MSSDATENTEPVALEADEPGIYARQVAPQQRQKPSAAMWFGLGFLVIIALAVASAAGLIPFVGGCVAPLLWPVVVVGNLILAILGGLEANKGIIYRYPFCLRLIT